MAFLFSRLLNKHTNIDRETFNFYIAAILAASLGLIIGAGWFYYQGYILEEVEHNYLFYGLFACFIVLSGLSITISITSLSEDSIISNSCILVFALAYEFNHLISFISKRNLKLKKSLL